MTPGWRWPSRRRLVALLSPVVALAATFAVAALAFGLLGYPGLTVTRQLVLDPLIDSARWPDLLVKAAPLTLIATGLSFGFRANVWNIGAEGQYVMGAIAGTGIALATAGQEGVWILPAMALAGILGGMAWAAIPAFLRTRLGVSEILTSLMLTYVALQVLNYLVRGPWRDPAGFNFPQTAMFGTAQTMPALSEGSVVHLGIPVAFVVAVAAAILLDRTITGFGIKLAGLAPAAAAYGGFGGQRTIWMTLLVGGGLAGLAGLFEAAGPFGQLTPQFPAGYGFSGIIVAFLGRLHPLGIVPGALALAATAIGGEHVQASFGLPSASAGVFQALLLFALLGADAAATRGLPRWAPRRLVSEPA